MPADAVVGLIQAAGALINLGTSISSTTDAAKRNADLLEFQKALIGLNGLIATVQQDNATLRGQKDEAEAALKRMQDWEVQKQRYQLVAPFPACMVYALKQEASSGEPPHYLCAACFQKGQRSILQGMETTTRRKKDTVGQSFSVYACSVCEAEAVTHWKNVVPPQYAEDVITQQR